MVCGIWLNGKHCDFTGSSPDIGGLYGFGRKKSSQVNTSHSTVPAPYLEMPQIWARCKIMGAGTRKGCRNESRRLSIGYRRTAHS